MILLILMTFAFATNAVMGQLMWINHRNDEGGPLAYFAASTNSWFETLGTSLDVVANIMADALLVIILHWLQYSNIQPYHYN